MILNKEKSIKLIAALSDNDIIANEKGELPWVLPGDLKRFRELTTGNTVVMGWNTWRSLGEKPLPNRMNIVLSRKNRNMPRSKLVHHIKNPMEIYTIPRRKRMGNIWIIGGAQVYLTYMLQVDEMYLTFVHKNIPNEEKCIKFPKIKWSDWINTEVKSNHIEIYRENDTDYEFRHYVRSTLS